MILRTFLLSVLVHSLSASLFMGLRTPSVLSQHGLPLMNVNSREEGFPNSSVLRSFPWSSNTNDVYPPAEGFDRLRGPSVMLDSSIGKFTNGNIPITESHIPRPPTYWFSAFLINSEVLGFHNLPVALLYFPLDLSSCVSFAMRPIATH